MKTLIVLIKLILTVTLSIIGVLSGALTVAYENKPYSVPYGIACVLSLFLSSMLLWNIYKTTFLNFENIEEINKHS